MELTSLQVWLLIIYALFIMAMEINILRHATTISKIQQSVTQQLGNTAMPVTPMRFLLINVMFLLRSGLLYIMTLIVFDYIWILLLASILLIYEILRINIQLFLRKHPNINLRVYSAYMNIFFVTIIILALFFWKL